MHEKLISRRDALPTIFFGSAFLLHALYEAGSKPKQKDQQKANVNPDSTYDFINLNDKNTPLRYADTFQLPRLSIDKPIKVPDLNSSQRELLEGIGINTISLQDSPNLKTTVRIDFNDNVNIGSPYNVEDKANLGTPVPSFAIIWANELNGRLVAAMYAVQAFSLDIDRVDHSLKGMDLEFGFKITQGRTYVIILNSRLLKIKGKETPPITIPFQLERQTTPSIRPGENRS